jgi:hypothetical protein
VAGKPAVRQTLGQCKHMWCSPLSADHFGLVEIRVFRVLQGWLVGGLRALGIWV